MCVCKWVCVSADSSLPRFASASAPSEAGRVCMADRHGGGVAGGEKREAEKKCLTGVGAESQRGLETPGVEVRGSSLKHERHRQGNKHDLPPASCFDANNLTAEVL